MGEKSYSQKEHDWDASYKDGTLPWDSGEPASRLQQVVKDYDIEPSKALDIGCGTGTNTIWLASQGFTTTGVDLSETAIGIAREKALRADIESEWLVQDILEDPLPHDTYDFVYDRGCFHTFDDADDRAQFAQQVANTLKSGGLWHSLLGSTDDPPRDYGPPQRSATDIIKAVEPFFKILELRSAFFDLNMDDYRPRAWVFVGQRRDDGE